MNMANVNVPDIATDAVLVRSEQMPSDAKIVKGSVLTEKRCFEIRI